MLYLRDNRTGASGESCALLDFGTLLRLIVTYGSRRFLRLSSFVFDRLFPLEPLFSFSAHVPFPGCFGCRTRPQASFPQLNLRISAVPRLRLPSDKPRHRTLLALPAVHTPQSPTGHPTIHGRARTTPVSGSLLSLSLSSLSLPRCTLVATLALTHHSPKHTP